MEEADGFWRDLLAWRASHGGLYSFSEAEGQVRSVRFLAEAPRAALLITLLVLLPSVTFRPRSGTVRAEPTPG
ncbi:MAG: hypothetical protein M3Y59_04100 [Myxococcota bacterium]|nr:hypothetical protein [Myxococcota bacterium]